MATLDTSNDPGNVSLRQLTELTLKRENEMEENVLQMNRRRRERGPFRFPLQTPGPFAQLVGDEAKRRKRVTHTLTPWWWWRAARVEKAKKENIYIHTGWIEKKEENPGHIKQHNERRGVCRWRKTCLSTRLIRADWWWNEPLLVDYSSMSFCCFSSLFIYIIVRGDARGNEAPAHQQLALSISRLLGVSPLFPLRTTAQNTTTNPFDTSAKFGRGKKKH